MKNKKWLGPCLAVIVLVGGAGAQQSAPPAKRAAASKSSADAKTGTTAPASPQKVVLKVGSARITQSDIETVISHLGTRAKVIVATQGLRPVGDEYVKTLVLSQRALEEHLESSPSLRFQLELQREQTLAQAEYEKLAGEVRVSPEEVSQYFAAHQPEFETVQVREFLIRKRPAGSNDPKQGLPIKVAWAKAEAIRKALLTGKDIEKVAADFSDPPDVFLADWRMRNLRRTEMKPALSKATFDLKNGGVTEPVDMVQTFIVAKVFGHHDPELKEVSPEIESRLKQQKLDAEVDNLKKQAGVWMDATYFSEHPAGTPSSANQQPMAAPVRANH